MNYLREHISNALRKHLFLSSSSSSLNESAESDIKTIKEAKRIYNRIKNNINKIRFKSTDIENDFLKDTKGNIHKIYGVKFNLNQLDKTYDLNIIFAYPIGKNNIEHHYDYKNNRILFFILSQSNNKEDFTYNEHLAKIRFNTWVDENIFIHEFIHFLDNNRYDNTYTLKNPSNKYEYYNSPEEYNAYSQEIINKIIKEKNKLIDLPFDIFLNKVLKFANNKDFINTLNEKYLNKLKNRLYKLYSELRKNKYISNNTLYKEDHHKTLSYDDVIKKQKVGDPYFDGIFSDKTSEFVEEKIHIEKLRELNGFHNNTDDDELEQTISNFRDNGFDEDYYLSKKLMNKIVDGIKLNPIVVDEKYKILDGRHRLAAYSELWFYYGYDFPFDGVLEIYKRIKN